VAKWDVIMHPHDLNSRVFLCFVLLFGCCFNFSLSLSIYDSSPLWNPDKKIFVRPSFCLIPTGEVLMKVPIRDLLLVGQGFSHVREHLLSRKEDSVSRAQEARARDENIVTYKERNNAFPSGGIKNSIFFSS
jgi:hypothetical protein